MSKKPAKDEALEALDFIINILKEHEKDLDRLVSELAGTTEKFSQTGEIATKIEKVENRLTNIQTEINNLINYISPSTQQTPSYTTGPPVTVRCKLWEDFKTLAAEAETISFLYKEEENVFQADALKNGKILTYSGEFPRDSRLLKIWLSKELNVPEDKIFEGVLAIG